MPQTARLTASPDIYHVKQSKKPDHLANLVRRVTSEEVLQFPLLEERVNEIHKKHLLKKRIDNILQSSTMMKQVSPAVPYKRKKWVSPLETVTKDATQILDEILCNTMKECPQQVESRKQLKILDINKQLRYFGEYLQLEFRAQKRVHVLCPASKQSKIKYLSKKYALLDKGVSSKLCIMAYNHQQERTFKNYLQKDEVYQKIIRKEDMTLSRLLVEALQLDGKFTFTSYCTFYDLFVWQLASKQQQDNFACQLLMGDRKELSIKQISSKIQLITSKLNVQIAEQSWQHLSETIKKLLFGVYYQNCNSNNFLLSRKALMNSLVGNEECTSIFMNIFYTI